ncbi:COMM domain-containing protein 4 isoform X1 [Macrobrachium rosenbergii]|uniref:COMM domain-containing protein 4 isoform X1 n=1 Tax=Macrobrachium rosenbergii TaxID=79674 RepID=UPI0034D65A9C
MRFRFCWDVDCPDWLLAEITTLSKLTSVKLRLLTGNVAKAIYGPTLSHDVVTKLAKDAKLDEQGAKAVVAAVRWVLESAAGAGVTANVLDSELQQLGLPKEHATAITKVYTEHQEALQAHLKNASLKVRGGTTWSCEVVGVDIGDGDLSPVVKLNLHNESPSVREGEEQEGGTETVTSIAMTPDQLQAMIHELTEARQLMEGLH